MPLAVTVARAAPAWGRCRGLGLGVLGTALLMAVALVSLDEPNIMGVVVGRLFAVSGWIAVVRAFECAQEVSKV